MINCVIIGRDSLNGIDTSGEDNEINRTVKRLEDKGHKVIDIIPYFHNNGAYIALTPCYVMIKYITKDEVATMYKSRHHK